MHPDRNVTRFFPNATRGNVNRRGAPIGTTSNIARNFAPRGRQEAANTSCAECSNVTNGSTEKPSNDDRPVTVIIGDIIIVNTPNGTRNAPWQEGVQQQPIQPTQGGTAQLSPSDEESRDDLLGIMTVHDIDKMSKDLESLQKLVRKLKETIQLFMATTLFVQTPQAG